MKADAPHKRRGLLWPGVFTLLALALLLGLGTWQVERKIWKEKLIETLNTRITAAPEALPPAGSWDSLNQADTEFRRVTFRAEFLPPNPPNPRNFEARVYTAGSGLRDDIKEPGYFVFAPARLADGRIVVVNRGFVVGQPNRDTKPAPLPQGPIDIVGILRWPEERGWFVPPYRSHEDIFYARTVFEMTSQKEWNTTAPFYVEQESPTPPGGVPKPAALHINLPNNHLQYAVTWYGLALVLVGVFAAWARSRRPGSQ